MARLLILLALAATTYWVIVPGGSVPVEPSAVVASPAPAAATVPGLDLLSLAIGLAAGFVAGWMWQLPWRTVPELFREVALRSVRGVGLVGMAMGAAAILLFY